MQTSQPTVRQFGHYDTMVQTGVVFVGLLLIVAVVYLFVLLSIKLLGAVFLLGGMWLVIYFPWQMDYQRSSFVGSARIIGVIFILLGITLMII